jgi:hypothetical protein
MNGGLRLSRELGNETGICHFVSEDKHSRFGEACNSRTRERGRNVAAVRLLFVVSGRSGVWSAPGLSSDQRMINFDGWCAWRLVGANNREVARSARTFPTFHECYQAARQVQHRLDVAATSVRHDDDLNLWAWRVEIDGIAVATSGRMYQRHRECQSNVAQFFELMPIAATAYDSAPVPAISADALATLVPTQSRHMTDDELLRSHRAQPANDATVVA